MIKSNANAFIAGLCAAGASVFGKLSGNSEINIYISVLCIAVMIGCNAVMWTFFSKALNSSNTSIGPTLVSSASNYILSGLLGVFMFGESTSLLWWSGIGFVLIGLLLISNESKDNKLE